jgi:hypothetical protein
MSHNTQSPASASAAGTLAAADYELMKLGAKSAIAVTTVATPYVGTETLVGVPGMGTKTVTEMGGAAGLAAYVTANSSCTATLVGTALTITADAYGTALNGTVVSGTLLAASGTMAGGMPPQLSNPMPSNQQRASVAIYDAAFNDAAITVGSADAPLSSSKRYHIFLVVDASAVMDVHILQPNGSDAGCNSYVSIIVGGGPGFAPGLYMGRSAGAGDTTKIVDAVIGPRVGGFATFSSTCKSAAANDQSGTYMKSDGATTTDWTYLTIVVGAAARTGWLKVIEETP